MTYTSKLGIMEQSERYIVDMYAHAKTEADDLRAYNAECVRAMRDHLKTYVRTEKDQRTKSVYLSAVLTLADLERILERVTA